MKWHSPSRQPATKTPSAPGSKACSRWTMSTLPVQGTWMMLTSGGYCNRIEPARSAAEYAQYMQQKPMIFGSKSTMAALLN